MGVGGGSSRSASDTGSGSPDSGKSEAHGRRGFILVVGNEEHGLSTEVKDGCSYLARIPGTGNIESLNVAQAATLFLHELYEA